MKRLENRAEKTTKKVTRKRTRNMKQKCENKRNKTINQSSAKARAAPATRRRRKRKAASKKVLEDECQPKGEGRSTFPKKEGRKQHHPKDNSLVSCFHLVFPIT